MRSVSVPTPVLLAIDSLEWASYEAYLVGGGLRDSLLGMKVEDYDLTTDATPDEMKRVFAGYRFYETGIAHGTLQVIIEGMPLEITTYRSDGIYIDHRHPQEVQFSKSLEEDLARRDFTVNAMAYHPKKGLIDLYQGMEDLKNKCLRSVGDPGQRFHEDALRILRALRLAAKLDFTIEETTSAALTKECHLLDHIANERILKELLGLLRGTAAQRVLNDYMSVLACVIPEIDVQDAPLLAEALSRMDNASYPRLAALFHRIPQELLRSLTRRLRIDKRTAAKVEAVLEGFHETLPTTLPDIRRFTGKYREVLWDIIDLKEATGAPDHLREFREEVQGILERREALSLDELAVDGEDLLQEGIRNGPEIGVVLDKLLDLVYEDPMKNTRWTLLEYARKITESGS